MASSYRGWILCVPPNPGKAWSFGVRGTAPGMVVDQLVAEAVRTDHKLGVFSLYVYHRESLKTNVAAESLSELWRGWIYATHPDWRVHGGRYLDPPLALSSSEAPW